jgi:hypothetical protein
MGTTVMLSGRWAMFRSLYVWMAVCTYILHDVDKPNTETPVVVSTYSIGLVFIDMMIDAGDNGISYHAQPVLFFETSVPFGVQMS